MPSAPRRSTEWLMRVALRWVAVRPTLERLRSHRTALVAAGCAFYATLALFPAISMLLSLYGLAFNPRSVEPQLALLQGLLPPEAHTLIARQVHALVSYPRRTLGLSLVIGAMITLWSAVVGTTSMLAALNLAYDETERRGFLRFQLTGFALTLAAIIGAVLALALLVALPAMASFVGLPHGTNGPTHYASLAVMMAYVAVSFAALYRFGPSRRPGRRHRILPGTLVATVLWLIASLLFTDYVERIASFDATYGPLAAVAGVMLWFWVSVYAVLAGAELNSALELQSEAPDDLSG
jgi:membrane protein